QSLIQVGLFASLGPQGPRRTRRAQFPQPALHELDVERRIGELKRIEAGWRSALQREIHAAQGPNQYFQSTVLVKDDLGDPLPSQHGDQEADEDRLAGTCGSTNERVAGVLWATPV